MNKKVEKQKNIYKHMSDKLPIGGVVRGSISDNGWRCVALPYFGNDIQRLLAFSMSGLKRKLWIKYNIALS